MTGIGGLTGEQGRFVQCDGGIFVHACPGAGKTRTIMARLARIATTLPPRRGLAVLSFTNSAVDEFRERCRSARLDPLLKHPSFMGTLDAFVKHFIVMPSCAETSAVRPIIVDSWDSLGIEIRLAGQYAYRGDPVSLDAFDPDTNIIDPEKIAHAGLRAHVRQYQARYQQIAASRRQGLLGAGYLSAGDARAQALRLIRDPVASVSLGRALSARFYEVMVDEGQDCNPHDLQILAWLRHHGIHVTFVCDPDQAIYEFRNGCLDSLRAFRSTYPVESRLRLTGNFRSSHAICRLAATLRGDGRMDEAVGSFARIPDPILLITYDGNVPSAGIGQAFLDHVAAAGLSKTDAIMLSHSSKAAQQASGSLAMSDSMGSSKIEALASIVERFWSPAATARKREMAVQAVEALLLDFMGQRQAGEHLTRAIERAAINRRAHRRRALDLLMNLPKTCAPTDADRIAWISSVHAGVERLCLQLPPGETIRGFFRKPPNNRWINHLQAPVELGLACANIHEAKGREYDAVCVVIPPSRRPSNRSEDLIQAWESRADTEAKRVIFVGVTRARRLNALAIPAAFTERLTAVLVAGEVPHIRRNL